MGLKEWFQNSIRKTPKVYAGLNPKDYDKNREAETEMPKNQLLAILFASVNQDGEIDVGSLPDAVRQQLGFSKFKELIQDEEIQAKIQNLQYKERIEEMEEYARGTSSLEDDRRVAALKEDYLRLVRYYDKVYIKEVPHFPNPINESPMPAVPADRDSFLKRKWLSSGQQNVPTDGWLVEKEGSIRFIPNSELKQYDVCDIYGDSIIPLNEFDSKKEVLDTFDTFEEKSNFYRLFNDLMVQEDIEARIERDPSFFRFLSEEKRNLFAEQAIRKDPFNIYYITSPDNYSKLAEIAIKGNPNLISLIGNVHIPDETFVDRYFEAMQTAPPEVSTSYHMPTKEIVLSEITQYALKDTEGDPQRIYKSVESVLENTLAQEETNELLKKEPILQKKVSYENIKKYISTLKELKVKNTDSEQKEKIESSLEKLEKLAQGMEKDCTSFRIVTTIPNLNRSYNAIPIIGKSEFIEKKTRRRSFFLMICPKWSMKKITLNLWFMTMIN